MRRRNNFSLRGSSSRAFYSPGRRRREQLKEVEGALEASAGTWFSPSHDFSSFSAPLNSNGDPADVEPPPVAASAESFIEERKWRRGEPLQIPLVVVRRRPPAVAAYYNDLHGALPVVAAVVRLLFLLL